MKCMYFNEKGTLIYGIILDTYDDCYMIQHDEIDTYIRAEDAMRDFVLVKKQYVEVFENEL